VGAPGAASADPSAMEEVLGILRAQGVIDKDTSEKVLAKHVAEQKKASVDAAGLLGGFEWYGDLRLRYEAFSYDDDAFGNDKDNRYRGRYRARFGFKKTVNDSLKVGVRLASGGGDLDSTNRSFGESPDFGGDGIFFDRAWLDLKLVDQSGMSMNLVGGRVANPYLWKEGKDFVIWDGDINMTGAYLATSFKPAEKTELFITLGSFIAREKSTEADPKIVGAQVGYTTAVNGLGFGVRGSLYEYRSLDSGFIMATTADGNLVGPSGDDDGAFDDGRIRVADLTAFVSLSESENWPMKVYGTYARNLSADSFVFNDGMNPAISVDEEDNAYGLGFEIGSKKKTVALGLGYFHLEANSVVGQFTDSDLFDGKTNREGFIFYGARQVAKNTDFKLTFFSGEEIEDDGASFSSGGPFTSSLGDADRMRLQADIEVKF